MYARRKVSLFVLRDRSGRVLLQHRDKDAPFLADYWAFFGGGINKNETPSEAVKREAEEELGIKLGDLKFFKKYEFQEEDGLYEKFVFIASLKNSPKNLKEQQQEGKNLGVFSFEELKNLKISDNDMIILKDIFIN